MADIEYEKDWYEDKGGEEERLRMVTGNAWLRFTTLDELSLICEGGRLRNGDPRLTEVIEKLICIINRKYEEWK